MGKNVRPASRRLGVPIPARQTLVVKTGSGSSTAKRSAIDVGVTCPRTQKHDTSKRQSSADERKPSIQLQFHPAVGP